MAVIAVDLDHTLVEGDKALPGAKEAINILREKGHKILIHSCNNYQWVERVLNDNDIRFDSIWERKGKPVADLYIDDKGYRFAGNWESELPAITELVSGFDNMGKYSW